MKKDLFLGMVERVVHMPEDREDLASVIIDRRIHQPSSAGIFCRNDQRMDGSAVLLDRVFDEVIHEIGVPLPTLLSISQTDYRALSTSISAFSSLIASIRSGTSSS